MVVKEKNSRKCWVLWRTNNKALDHPITPISVVSRLDISEVLYQAHRKGYLVWTMELLKRSRCCKHFLIELTRQHSRYPRCYYLKPIEFIMYIVSLFYLSFLLFKNDRVQKKKNNKTVSISHLRSTLSQSGMQFSAPGCNWGRQISRGWGHPHGSHRLKDPLPTWHVGLSPIILLGFYGIHCLTAWDYLVFSKADFYCKTRISNNYIFFLVNHFFYLLLL